MNTQKYPSQWGRRYHFDNVYNPCLSLSMVELYQAGEIIAGDGYEIPEHTQECAEISYVVSGCCDFYTDGQVFHAREGDVHVISPGRRHRIVADSTENLRMAYIGFYLHEEEADPARQALNAFYEDAPCQLRCDRNHLKAAVEQLLTEIYVSKDYSREVVDACITQILITVWRLFRYGPEESGQRVSDEARMERIVGHTVLRALRYIDTNIGQIENVSQVAGQLRYNATYLSKVFRERMGITMSEYIAGKRIEEAKKLLHDGVSVSKTAQRLGYASSQSFCKMFRRHTGQIPSDFSRKGKDNEK